VGPSEDEEVERVPHRSKNNDESQVVEIEKIETLLGKNELTG